jgi:hypothetical protein
VAMWECVLNMWDRYERSTHLEQNKRKVQPECSCAAFLRRNSAFRGRAAEISLGQMGPAIQDKSLSEPSHGKTCDIVYPCLSFHILSSLNSWAQESQFVAPLLLLLLLCLLWLLSTPPTT